ncbi:MAG: acyl-CoA dehydrogenase family protein, partial [Acidimicrobiales bacterium]
MDFALDDAQQAVVESAAAILAGAASGPDNDLGAFESARASGIDRDLWETLAGANLLGLAVTGEDGGSDLGLFEVYLLLEQAGRAAAVAPLWPTLVLAGLPLARFATAAQRERWLRPLAAGRLIGTAALVEVGADPATPTADATTVARRHDSG